MEVIMVLSGRVRSRCVKDTCELLERGAQGKLKAVPFLRPVRTEQSVPVVKVWGLSPLPLVFWRPGGGGQGHPHLVPALLAQSLPLVASAARSEVELNDTQVASLIFQAEDGVQS